MAHVLNKPDRLTQEHMTEKTTSKNNTDVLIKTFTQSWLHRFRNARTHMRMQTHTDCTQIRTQISTQSATAGALAALVRWQGIRKQKDRSQRKEMEYCSRNDNDLRRNHANRSNTLMRVTAVAL